MWIQNAMLYRTEERQFRMGNLLIRNGMIEAVDLAEIPTEEEIVDAGGKRVVPGLVDIHTHGRVGYDFTSAEEEQLSIMAASYAQHGVTTVLPTLASAPLAQMQAAARQALDHVAGENEAAFRGLHLEGRYLNVKRKGAHAEDQLAPLDAKEIALWPMAEGKAFHITAAFELDGDGSFACAARERGMTMSLGHTDASFEEAKQLEERGICSYSHLYNAMPPLHHRGGGAVAASLTGTSYFELICDGIHISPEMILLACRAGGAERAVLITDSMAATGMPDGTYGIGGNASIVKNGIARTADGALAGSTLTLDQAVRNWMRMCSLPLETAILAATATPARAVGLYDRVGSLEADKWADLLILSDDKEFEIERILLRGRFLSAEGTCR
ncbi:MAG: N-acetylglucosamine-6-phosphate deacetylase [Clostridia bacterium]|nr:N-acetylglucosamine-6-phosphate deacetylase [Clostridia bacterium]